MRERASPDAIAAVVTLFSVVAWRNQDEYPYSAPGLPTQRVLFVATSRENFRSWFVNVLDSLYPRREAGFVILMTAFPLLERYLRQKSGIPAEDSRLSPRFYDELRTLFPQLPDTDKAKTFWTIYRNGLLHQATFSEQRAKFGHYAFASHDLHEAIIIDQRGNFGIHPVYFAKQILEHIENDFGTYEGTASVAPPLSAVTPYDYYNYHAHAQRIEGTALPSAPFFDRDK
jgi:hypothetical protein